MSASVEATRPASVRLPLPVTPVRIFERAHSRSGALTLGALGVWLLTRVGLLLAGVCGNFTTQSYQLPAKPSWLTGWSYWDAHWYLDIAQHGYFYGPDQADHFGRATAAFFPGTSLLIRAVHVVVPQWTVAGLVVSALCSAVAFVALAHLCELELTQLGVLDPARRRSAALLTVLALALSPMGVFLVAPYSEAPWLAAVLVGWWAARNGHWWRAGLFVALACACKPNGLFVAAALVLAYVGYRRHEGSRIIAVPMLALALPALPVAAYFSYLHAKTGDWDAWQHAQIAGWGRQTVGLATSWRQTWQAAFDPHEFTDFAWARRGELLVAVLGVLLTLWLVRIRRFAEATYMAIAWLSLATDGLYLSFPRSTLLWFPLWLLLARVFSRHRWAAYGWIGLSAPVAFVSTVAFVTGHWVN